METQQGAEIFIEMVAYYKTSTGVFPLAPGAMDHVLIISCIDKRILGHVFERIADTSYIFRNGGARITQDVIRSAAPAIAEAGVNEIILLMHTDCLFHKLTDCEIRQDLHKNLGPCTSEFVDGRPVARECEFSSKCNRDKHRKANCINFDTFKNLRKAVIRSVKNLRQSALISRHVRISGMIYVVETDEIIYVIDDPACKE